MLRNHWDEKAPLSQDTGLSLGVSRVEDVSVMPLNVVRCVWPGGGPVQHQLKDP